MEACSVLRMPENWDTLCLEKDDCIPGMKRIADAVHRYPAVTLVQIMLTGLSTMTESRIDEITRTDFLRYKNAFVSAAFRCQAAGFDGIELHAAHGMYLDEVVETSERMDEYGGSFENRVRLLAELIAEIRKKCGKDFIIAVRFGNPNYEELLKKQQMPFKQQAAICWMYLPVWDAIQMCPLALHMMGRFTQCPS